MSHGIHTSNAYTRTAKDVADADHRSLESFNGCHDSLVLVVVGCTYPVKFAGRVNFYGWRGGGGHFYTYSGDFILGSLHFKKIVVFFEMSDSGFKIIPTARVQPPSFQTFHEEY